MNRAAFMVIAVALMTTELAVLAQLLVAGELIGVGVIGLLFVFTVGAWEKVRSKN